MITARTYPGTQAVARAVSLLKAFSDARRGWRLTDLARAAHLHKATAHRLLAALEREGMVTRDPAGGEHYRLGPEAIALGARAARASDLRATVVPELETLAASSGETATLEVPAGGAMLILHEVPGGALLGAVPEVGTRWPLHATSTGKALLALMPGSQRRDLVGARLSRHTPRTIISSSALDRELDRIRRRGYAVAAEELERGYVAVGAAVQDSAGRPVAAISLGGPRVRFPATRIALLGRQVRTAAERISQALGYRGTPC
ncbi:MAG TPA: IclR family transcriptional regulator [Gemmatimonadales bacterium]|nr:IclR family transcriptional regulator [Gemmatimonadales bacterium]